jgi:rare lipoprotein A
VIVRVNDRGPFKHDRVIDLSYAAAVRLGYAAAGTAEVEVVRLTHADIRAGRLGMLDPATLLAFADPLYAPDESSRPASGPVTAAR